MEAVIEHVSGNRSAHELAIHFLLRHAQRRMALTAETEDRPCAETALRPLNPSIEFLPEPAEPKLFNAVSVDDAGAAESIQHDSFSTRFLLAYAAARAN